MPIYAYPTYDAAEGATGWYDDLYDHINLASVSTQAGTSYTFVLGNAGTTVEFSNAAAIAATVPPFASVAFDDGTLIEVVQIGAGQLTLVAGSGVTIEPAATLRLSAQWSSAVLRKRSTNAWLLIGDITS